MAVTCAYFDCGNGKLSEANAKRAREIRACHRTLGIPWILAADFNATPEQTAASGLQAIIGGKVMTPHGVSYTCSAGQKRMLDYWMVSDDARPYITNEGSSRTMEAPLGHCLRLGSVCSRGRRHGARDGASCSLACEPTVRHGQGYEVQ